MNSASQTQTNNHISKPTTFNSSHVSRLSSDQTRRRSASGEDHWVRGNVLRDEGKYEEASREYELAIDQGYDDSTIRIELGLILEHYLGRPSEAMSHYRVAIQRDPGDWSAHWSLARALCDAKNYDEALTELETSKQLDPEGRTDGFYTYYTGKTFDALGRRDEALTEYEAFLKRARIVEPESPRVREVRARVGELDR